MEAIRTTIILGSQKVAITTRTSSVAVDSNYVRVKPIYCGICGSDLHRYFLPKGRTTCPGHEISGVVKEVGKEVKTVVPGDRVTVEPKIACGKCNLCSEGKFIFCPYTKILGYEVDGGLSDDLIVPDYVLFKLPEDVDQKTGSLTEPIAVAVHAFRTMGYEPGTEKTNQNILILGAGTIGLVCLPVAAFFGFKSISISVKYKFQEDLVRKLESALNIKVTIYDSKLEGLTEKPKQIIEAVGGSSATLSTATENIEIGGTIVLLGIFLPGTVSVDAFTILMKSLTIIGSNCYDRMKSPVDFQVAIQILQKYGEILKNNLISHEFKLDEISSAFATAHAKNDSQAIKVTIKV